MTPQISRNFGTIHTQPNIIPLSPEMAAAVQSVPKDHLIHFFQQIRLNMQSRIVGCTDAQQLTKLQGKLESINEIEQLFLNVLQPKK